MFFLQSENSWLCPFLYLSADPDGNADDHGGDGDAGDEGDPHRSPHQGAQLPQDLLLPAPRLLTPERAAGGTVEGENRDSFTTVSATSENNAESPHK